MRETIKPMVGFRWLIAFIDIQAPTRLRVWIHKRASPPTAGCLFKVNTGIRGASIACGPDFERAEALDGDEEELQ